MFSVGTLALRRYRLLRAHGWKKEQNPDIPYKKGNALNTYILFRFEGEKIYSLCVTATGSGICMLTLRIETCVKVTARQHIHRTKKAEVLLSVRRHFDLFCLTRAERNSPEVFILLNKIQKRFKNNWHREAAFEWWSISLLQRHSSLKSSCLILQGKLSVP